MRKPRANRERHLIIAHIGQLLAMIGQYSQMLFTAMFQRS